MAKQQPKIALVTGANRGIGYEVALGLAEKGFLTLVGGRDLAKADEAAARIRDKGFEARAVQVDVADVGSIIALERLLNNDPGRLDVLVNNAGVFLDPHEGVFEVPEELVRETFETNFYGPFHLLRALAPMLRQSGAATVVNVSSGYGALNGMAGGSPAYRISKTALNALTQIAAAELRQDGVKVNAVCPGWVRTEMGGASAPRSAEEGAGSVLWAATLPSDGPTGGFFRDGKPIAW